MRRYALLLVLGLILGAGVAGAQTRGPAHAYVLWDSCQAPGTIRTLSDLAHRLKPALWFAAQEPLRSLAIPQAWSASRQTERVVYYRIHRLRSSGSDRDLWMHIKAAQEPKVASLKKVGAITDGLDEALRGRFDGFLWDEHDRVDQELVADLELDAGLLERLKDISIRYMFYYPLDSGVGSHLHDLEAVEVQLDVERRDGEVPQSPCYTIWVHRVFGAAHGLGLQTNILDIAKVEQEEDELIQRLRRAPDRGRLADRVESLRMARPLLVYVESGKHASAPSRDGDRWFDMGIDVNVSTSDAWGIRDTMRSNRLAPDFNDSMVAERTLEAYEQYHDGAGGNGQERGCRESDWAGTVAQDTSSRVRNRICPGEYTLLRTTNNIEGRTSICGRRYNDRDRHLALREFASTFKDGEKSNSEPKWVEALLDGKGFCDGTKLDGEANFFTVMEKLRVGVNHTPYSTVQENVSVGLRIDRGKEISVIVPTGWPVPLFGGWVVPRVGFGRRDEGEEFPWVKSVDLVFTTSASAFLSPWVRVGADVDTCRGPDASSTFCRRQESDGLEPEALEGFTAAMEVGISVRFKPFKFAPMLGGKFGLRWNGWADPRRIRGTLEIGSVTW
jgi:hypothetical protein